MVAVDIKSHEHANTVKDLVFLEFRGTIDSGMIIDLSDVKIGQLTLEKDTAILVIGQNKIYGKKVNLLKPFAVIRKQEENMGEDTTYEVVTILKDKYVFKDRPQLIVQESLRGLARAG
ncbi:hypothetical protein BDB01DRAFT_793239 [Pilobolus umbonatus]|nr:hypothetical protein BDB01DRAFT_793239 [Pilobolus umbonatus]